MRKFALLSKSHEPPKEQGVSIDSLNDWSRWPDLGIFVVTQWCSKKGFKRDEQHFELSSEATENQELLGYWL